MDRRSFLRSAAILAGTSLSTPVLASSASPASRKLLILGGTNFVGPAIVEAAIARGHEVTLFNRGITRPALFPEVEKLRGDRRAGVAGLAALGRTRRWDAVIDVWAAEESIVDASARLLADRVDYYHFVSSIAVYRSFSEPWMTERAELRLSSEGYGGEKARSERLIAGLYPDRSGVSRCPSIFGPRDPGSSLHFWLRGLHQNSTVLGPGTGDDPVQFVDVRDVARWVIHSVESELSGTFNTAAAPLRFEDFLALCQQAVESRAQLEWLAKDFLYANNVEAFTELPLWVPVEEDPGFFQISSQKARDRGFRTRDVGETISAAWRWYQSAFFEGTTFPHNGWGISNERMAELLDASRSSPRYRTE